MAITISIAPWDEDSDLTHESTTWQIASDEDFEDILDETNEDEVNLDVWTSDLVLPLNTEWYGRAKRHFDDGSESDWIGPVKLISIKNNINIEIKPDVYIRKPLIVVNEDELNDSELETFTVNLDMVDIKGQDVHFATTWSIKDSAGNVRYEEIKDRANIENIVLNKKEIDIFNLSRLIIEVVVNTSNNITSSISKLVYNMKNDNFEVFFPTTVTGGEDLILDVKPSLIEDGITRVRILLKDTDDNLIYRNYHDYFNVKIPGDFIETDKDYVLEISGYDSVNSTWTESKVYEFTAE